MPTILVLNSGSSSIKFSVYDTSNDARTRLFEGAVDGIGTEGSRFWLHDAAGKALADEATSAPSRVQAFQRIECALQSNSIPAPAAIGHRMVCGGPTVLENQRITPALIDEMERFTAFAPLHTPIAVYIMREAMRLFPGVPNFVCLDTYFHRTMPEVAAHLPIPEQYSAMGVRRYGYHGLSCESIVHQLAAQVPERLIVAHLGNGASITAIKSGSCIDTSMGLTPTGGIISGTRTGDIDPGVLIFILREIAKSTSNTHAAADALEEVAAKKSGLAGVSGLSNDMRELRKAIAADNKFARLAVDKFVWTIQRWIGSFFVELGGLDMLVFTGGIGQYDSATRASVCAGLAVLGVQLDPALNQTSHAALVSSASSRIAVRVLPPEEDLMIVEHVMRLLETR